MSGLFLSVGILSAGLIAYQLALLQILSISQWYHFAYMVISVALLGWGVAGTCLTLFRKFFIKHAANFLPLLFLLSSIFMVFVIYLTQVLGFSFDSYLLFTDISQVGRFLLSAVLYMLPFFWGALALGIIFILYTENIGKIYCANLIGSGVGGLIAIGLPWILLPLQIPVFVAFLPLIGSLFILRMIHFSKIPSFAQPLKEHSDFRKPGYLRYILGKRRTIILAASLIVITFSVICFFTATAPVLSEYKGLSRVLDMPGAKVVSAKNSPYGLVQTAFAPALRSAPCLSLKYGKTIPVSCIVFLNGEPAGSLIPFSDSRATEMYNFTTNAMPYVVRKPKNVLILGARTGEDIALALNQKAKSVNATESNPIICSILEKQLGKFNSKFGGPVILSPLDERAFLKSTKKLYDLIVIPSTNSFGGNAGLYAMQTQENLTVEAISEIWNRLSPHGLFTISCWQDYPPRHTLKIPATLVDVLVKAGVKNPKKHLVAIKSWGHITFFMSKNPFRDSEIKQIKQFCKDLLFDPVFLTNNLPDKKEAFHLSDDVLFAKGIQRILDQNKSFQSQYEFNITPSTDNRPYFSQFLKLRFLPHLLKVYGKQNIPFIELGYLIVVFSLIVLSLAAVILIILPLFAIGWKGKGKLRTLLYFSGIGLGYMFVEIVFIQYFIFYLGNAVYSAASVISAMLICSGLGSWLSDKKQYTRALLATKLGIIILLLVIYGVFIGRILHVSVGLPFLLKLLITFGLAGLPAFFMGMPFPVGLKRVSSYSKEQVPWGWGINSCMSVIGPLVAIIISVELGFSWVLLLAAAAYLLPLLASCTKR